MSGITSNLYKGLKFLAAAEISRLDCVIGYKRDACAIHRAMYTSLGGTRGGIRELPIYAGVVKW